MAKPTSTRPTRLITAYLQRHWLLLGVIAFFIAVAFIGAPAWAAPSPRPLNQTVPRPTPTSVGDPVATATPRPDSGDEDDGSNGSGGSGGDNGGDSGGSAPQLDAGLPDELQPDDTGAGAPAVPGGGSAAPGSANLTANVAVGRLNVRAEPSTTADVVGSLAADAQVTVEARNEDGTWWYICCVPGSETRGWVSAQFLTPSFDRAAANDLISVFGAEAPATATPAGTPQPPAAQTQQAESPLMLDFKIDPPFLWQGITGTLTITVTNPNTVDVLRAELSDELPPSMIYIDAEADADGTVTVIESETGNPLLIFRWPEIASETSVTAVIDFQVAEVLANGEVFDNLFGVQARNADYSSGVLTIGMPPVLPPSFD